MKLGLPFSFFIICFFTLQIYSLPDTLIHNGIATWYYDANVTEPACGFVWPSNGSYYCAMNTPDLHTNEDSALACGAYIHVESEESSIECPVIDECPWPQWCDDEQVDFSPWAFMALVADTSVGVIDITWWYVQGPMNDPLKYYFQKGSDEWWLSLQVRNHKQAIQSLEIKSGGSSWIKLRRTGYNFFIADNGAGNGPFDIRLTATTGEVITDIGIPLSPDNEVQGSKNFTETSIKGSAMKQGFTGMVNSKGAEKVFMAYGSNFKIPSACFGNNSILEIYSIQGKLIIKVPVEKSHIVELPKRFAQSMLVVRAKP